MDKRSKTPKPYRGVQDEIHEQHVIAQIPYDHFGSMFYPVGIFVYAGNDHWHPAWGSCIFCQPELNIYCFFRDILFTDVDTLFQNRYDVIKEQA